MGERLDDTLSNLLAGTFSRSPSLLSSPSRGEEVGGGMKGIESVSALVRRALNYYQSGVESLKKGDWAKYGESQRHLKQTLKEIEKRTQ